MEKFDPNTLRDPYFRKKFDAKKAEIESVKAQHTYVGYATNRSLFDELVEIYQENNKHFTQDYQTNLSSFRQLTAQISTQQKLLHPYHFQQLRASYLLIEKKLTEQSYAINAEAKPLIDALAEDFRQYLAAFQQWQSALKAYEAGLSDIKTSVWAEFYEQQMQQCRQLKAPIQNEVPGIPELPQEALASAIADRKDKVETLLTKLEKHPKLAAQVSAFSGNYCTLKDFESLQVQLLKKLKIKLLAKVGVWVIVVLLVGSAAIVAPFAYKHFTEEKSWTSAQTTNTWEAYEAYLHAYPNGKFGELAKEAMMQLPYGSLEGLVTVSGESYSYDGELDAGVPTGQGKAVFEDGKTYEGAWKAGSFWGQGHLSLPDGSSYTGEWEEGKRHGNGTDDNGQGDVYTGEWWNDKRHGQGTLIAKDGAKYLGQWVEGLPHGQGTYMAGEGSGASEFGFEWVSGSSYIGQWKRGKRQGTGTMRWEDGRVYQGKWDNNKPHGQGTLTWQEGSIFRGKWNNGQIDGIGTFVSKFREEDTGTWKGTPEAVTLYDDQGVQVKRGRLVNGLFIGD